MKTGVEVTLELVQKEKPDAVVIAVGVRPNEDLRETLRLGCREVHIVGDCGKLGRIREAVVQGDLAGRLI